MNFELAAASLVIGSFALFIFWGRSASGQQALLKVFGPARQPSKSRRRSRRSSTSSKSGTGRTSASRTGGSRSRRASSR